MVTVKDRFPLPVVSDLLHTLDRNKVFSTLDYGAVFSKENRPLTAFSKHDGHWQWVVMPFGLPPSPITFSCLMTNIFRSMIGQDIFVYLDDILVISPDVPSHFQRLAHVFF